MQEQDKIDFHWSIEEVKYVIRNVPCLKGTNDSEEMFSIGVSLKMAIIRDLMCVNEIPHDVDFDEVAAFEFD